MAQGHHQIKKLLKKAGWTLLGTTGGHEHWTHPSGARLTVPIHMSDALVNGLKSKIRQVERGKILTKEAWKHTEK